VHPRRASAQCLLQETTEIGGKEQGKLQKIAKIF